MGDTLQAVDGHALGAHDDLFALLENRIGKKTTLRIAGAGGARNVEIKPIDTHTLGVLAYDGWAARNRAYIAKVSGGRLGYVHPPDMSEASLHRLYRDLDAQNMTREGVVVDVRNNFGGFVNAYALDVLARKPYLNFPRLRPRATRAQHPGPARAGTADGAGHHRATLSDGEDFTEGNRELGLGKVVGEPTAGWIIHTTNQKLIDGATVRLPFITITTRDGQPIKLHPRPVDVAVSRPLGEAYQGRDSDLDAAVRTLPQQLGQ